MNSLHGIALACIAFAGQPLNAQEKSERYALRSALAGGLVGGVGALINRTPGQPMAQAFGDGFFKGVLGGFVMFQGKRYVRRITGDEHLEYAWPARILHSAGSSIVENAAANRPAFEQFHFNVGFVRLDWSARDDALRARLLPAALAGTIHVARRGSFDPGRTLRTGVLTFKTSEPIYGNYSVWGVTKANSVIYRSDVPEPTSRAVLAHELVHTLQYDDFAGATMFFTPVARQAAAMWPGLGLLGRFVYPDMHYAELVVHFAIHGGRDYCRSPLEREARFFASGSSSRFFARGYTSC